MRRVAFPLASASFLLSGVAALTYQIVWQRLLVLPLGADVYSMTLVVAAFMTGLGLGSLAGGHVADRLSPLRCVLLFIAAELGVAAFGLASRAIFYDWMYLRLGPAGLDPAVRAILVFATLLWPTFWMGVSLPVLSRAITPRIGDAARRVGILYGLNTLGAAAGAFATTWLLFPRIGFDSSLAWASVLNVSAALAVLPLVFKPTAMEAATASGAPGEGTDVRTSVPSGWPFAVWIALYGLAGFQALSLEIIWFRLLGVMMKASAFTFGTLLTIFLTGLGVGAALGSRLLRNVRRPGRAFLLLQAFVGLYAGASILALVAVLPSVEAAATVWAYLGGYEPVDAASAFRALWSPEGEERPAGAPFIRPVRGPTGAAGGPADDRDGRELSAAAEGGARRGQPDRQARRRRVDRQHRRQRARLDSHRLARLDVSRIGGIDPGDDGHRRVVPGVRGGRWRCCRALERGPRSGGPRDRRRRRRAAARRPAAVGAAPRHGAAARRPG